MGEGLLWGGLLVPLALSTNGPSRTRTDILHAPLSGTVTIRGGVPIACFALAVVVARPRLKPITNLEKLLVVYLAYAAVSVAWSIVPFATILRVLTLALALLSIIALARLHEQQGRNSMEALATVVYIILLVAAAEALVMPDRAFIHVSTDPTPRLSGVFPDVHPDYLGFYAAVAIVLLSARVGPTVVIQNRWVASSLLAAFLAVLLLTRTRSALILLPFGLLLIAPPHWWASMRRPRTLIIAAGCLAVLVLLLSIGHSLVSQFLLRQSFGLLTLTGRTVTWSHALIKWSQQPLVGFGYYAGHRFGLGEITDLDSMWLQTLLDLGILGVVLLALLLLAAVVGLWSSTCVNVEPHAVARRALFIMIIGASFINASLESIGYNQLLLGFVMFGAPRIGLLRRAQEMYERRALAAGYESRRSPGEPRPH
jgi:exopolysaccharide production protein ExoQ